MTKNFQSVKNWFFSIIQGNSLSVEQAVDLIVKEFSPEQLKKLEARSPVGNTVSFRDLLLMYNRKKTPFLNTEQYSEQSQQEIGFFKYMFDQENNEIATREVFISKFGRLFC